ncbi:MAG TPA: ABC transporter permease [Candidatus Acidoferrales bacterium]|jgi:putative ABC transport system permease protein|nr:ABC transporter permease [Candidatus Acidoferrales bacterium]
MDLLAILRIAIRALTRNKMRSLLTMLGIIIGVGAVIATVGLGQGAQQQVQNQIASMGTNLLYISSGSVNKGGIRLGGGATKTLVNDDMKAIEQEVPTIAEAAPGAGTSAQVVSDNQNWYTRVTGTEPQYFDIRNWTFDRGGNFTADDVQRATNVVVLGATVQQNLFGNTDSIGQTVRIGTLPFQVVGVLTAKGQSGLGQDQDDGVYVPITTLQKKITGQDWLQYIMASAVSQPASYAAQGQITALLRDRHRIRPGQDDDFTVRNLADVAQLADESSKVMTMLLASIAGVSLIVGGIGIMNIMLVSVTERTREIGIRIAIGATEGDVLRQFLSESVVLSLAGGIMGILFGVASSIAITKLLGWNILVSPAAMGAAVVFSMAVGIFFGFYPARKAAMLDPIEALRFE